jgi:hypothetical protein
MTMDIYFISFRSSLQLTRLTIGSGVAITFIFGLCSVFLASILTGKTRKKYFWGYRKNLCARFLNGFVCRLNSIERIVDIRFWRHCSSCYLVCTNHISSNIVMAWHCLSNTHSIVRLILRLFRRV